MIVESLTRHTSTWYSIRQKLETIDNPLTVVAEFFEKRLLINPPILGTQNTKRKPFFIDTPTEMGSEHPYPHKNLNFQWNIYSGRECNDFYNKNSVYVMSQLHLRRLSGWCLI